MTKRIALFVEGSTELLFVKALLESYASSGTIVIDEHQMKGQTPTRFFLRATSTADPTKKYYALICSSNADNRVVSDVIEQYPGLSAKGYDMVLGLRDIFPLPTTDLPRLISGIKSVLPTGPIPVEITIAIREVEAWFIAEHTHFERVNPALTTAHIQTSLGVDLTTAIVQDIPNPADFLHEIYRLVGMAYRKKRNQIQRVVDHLDYDRLVIDVAPKVSSLGRFCSQLEAFFA